MTKLDIETTIESFNPWWVSEDLVLGRLRLNYLKKVMKMLSTDSITFLIGSRRVGKTVLIFQIINKLQEQGVSPSEILFLSMDNTALQKMDLYSYIITNKFKYIFLDEIHYYQGWEGVLKSLFDIPTRHFTILCSGSSYRVINEQKGLLTGRNYTIEMYPLDYSEFKRFISVNRSKITKYMKYGGYPEYVLKRNPLYLSTLLQDILQKDIITVNKLRNSEQLFYLFRILAKQVGAQTSYQNISKIVGISDDTVKTYISYFQQVRLVDSLAKYSKSTKERISSKRKYYLLDSGMRNSITGFEDIGSLAENMAFVQLLKIYGRDNIFYLQNQRGQEVDFLVRHSDSEASLIEVKFSKFEEKVLSKLNYLIAKEKIYDFAIRDRIVVTDSLSKRVRFKDKEIRLVSLEDFVSGGEVENDV